MLWMERLEQAPHRLETPVVWVARHAEACAWPLPGPTAADLADAALARRDGGGPRLLRRRMARALVGRVCRVHPDAVAFRRDASGAPGLEDLDAYISTSGCDGWSAVAVSPQRIGVDVELDEGEATGRWCLAEAYLKALGTGLANGFELIDVGNTAPLPLDGGGVGGGGESTGLGQHWRGRRLPSSSLNRGAFTPTPSPSPIEGEGGRCCWMHRPTPEVVVAAVTLASSGFPPTPSRSIAHPRAHA